MPLLFLCLISYSPGLTILHISFLMRVTMTDIAVYLDCASLLNVSPISFVILLWSLHLKILNSFTFFLLLSTNRRLAAQQFIPAVSSALCERSAKNSFLYAQYCLLGGDINKLIPLLQTFRNQAIIYWPLYLTLSAISVHLNKLDTASQSLSDIPLLFIFALRPSV